MSSSTRTYPPRPEVITRLREAKGWSVETLVTKAAISRRTLNSVMAGNPGFRSTFAKIARALCVDTDLLIDGASRTPLKLTTETTETPRLFKIELTITGDFGHFDETTELITIIERLERLAHLRRPISDPEVSPGSVKLTIAIDELDLIQLIKAFRECELDELEISGITLPQEAIFLVLIACGLTVLAGVLATNPWILSLAGLGFYLWSPAKFLEAVTKATAHPDPATVAMADEIVQNMTTYANRFQEFVEAVNSETHNIGIDLNFDNNVGTLKLTKTPKKPDSKGTLTSDVDGGT